MAAEQYRIFDVRVVGRAQVSPHLVRVTFSGDDLDRFADNGADQRIKVMFGLGAECRFTPLDPQLPWFAGWRGLADADRNPLRTYTVRQVRTAQREVDIDMLTHGAAGPAGPGSTFAGRSGIGDRARLVGPNADFAGDHQGVEWRPPAGPVQLIIAGDESALPAIAAICEDLAADAVGRVIVEVPSAADAIEIEAPDGLSVTFLARTDRAVGICCTRPSQQRPARSSDPVGRRTRSKTLTWTKTFCGRCPTNRTRSRCMRGSPGKPGW